MGQRRPGGGAPSAVAADPRCAPPDNLFRGGSVNPVHAAELAVTLGIDAVALTGGVFQNAC